MLTLDLIGLGSFAALLIAAVVADLRWFRIPNKIVLALLVVFVAVRLPFLDLKALAASAAAAALLLVAGVMLYLRKVWGAGDAKLLAVVALWLQWGEVPRFLAMVAVTGGVIAVGMLLLRKLRGEGWGAAVPMPYGLAIAAGGLDWAVGHLIFASHLI